MSRADMIKTIAERVPLASLLTGLETADKYRQALPLLAKLKSNHKLSRQQRKTLRGQALSGDISGAWKGLEKLTRRAVVE